MHSKDFLAQQLRAAGLNEMADRAAAGWYHDFLSPLDAPAVQLEKDLRAAGTPEAEKLRQRHLNGEFDANATESEEWFKGPGGQDAMRRLKKEKKSGEESGGMKMRLALREEGNFWNAYLARPDSMEGAKLIGSVVIGAVKKNPDVKAAFMEVMKQVLADGIEDITGTSPTHWKTGPAPESERSGHS